MNTQTKNNENIFKEDLISTYCGSISREDLAEHLLACGVCGVDENLQGELS